MRNAIALVYGQKGAGKTTLLRRLIVRCQRVLVVDVTGDFAGDGLLTVSGFREAAARMTGRRWRLRLAADLRNAARNAYLADTEPRRLESWDPAAQLGPGAAWLAWAARSCVLLLDEMAYWCDPTYTPGTIRLISSYGRHRDVCLLGGSRRPAEISRHISAMADVVVSFRTTEPADLQYLRPIFGPAVHRLPQLAPFHGLLAGDPASLAPLDPLPLDDRIMPISRL